MKKVKLLTIILAIVLISIVGFIGVFEETPNRIENKVRDYELSSNLKGKRVVLLNVAQDENNPVEYTESDYKTVKKTIENRLKYYKASDYTVALNEKTGTIKVELEEDENTDYYIYKITQAADFKIEKEDENILLDTSSIKSVDANYDYIDEGYQAYIEIKLNNEGKEKLEEISNNYAILASDVQKIESDKETENTENTEETEKEEKTNEKTKEIAKVSINDTEYDVYEINKNKIKILVGSSTTSESTLEYYMESAYDLKGILESGLYNVEYDSSSEYISSEITKENLQLFVIVAIVIMIITLIFLVVKFKINGLLSAISHIGQLAVLSLLIRYTNVGISIEGILAIIIVQIINYALIFKMLNNLKQKMSIKEATIEAYKKIFTLIIPICVIALVACFTEWVSFTSFGLIMFWGLLIISIFNVLVTRLMLKINASK